MYHFIPFEFPKSLDGKLFAALSDNRIFFNRRTKFGLTQQQVADMAGVPLRQYQRLETGEVDLLKSSMGFGLSVCAVLMLDPYEISAVTVKQPDPSKLKPQDIIDVKESDVFPPKAGRKAKQRDSVRIGLNKDRFSIIIPYEALSLIGRPKYILMRWNIEKRRFLISASDAGEDGSFDVPAERNEKSLLAIPALRGKNPISEMNWGKEPYSVDSRIVVDNDGIRYILIDLNNAIPNNLEGFDGVYLTPECLTAPDDEDD